MKERQIRLFISSTFRDMNEERDYLNNYVFPQIKDYCESRYIDFLPVDLRWGITEEESKNGLVIASCMQEVDNARPFFVGILGLRYGWMPTIEELNCSRPSITQNQEWLLSKLIDSASITEIEMDYAALRDMSIPHASFFIKSEDVDVPEEFREEKGSVAEKKLKELKDKIKGQSKYPVYSYHNPSEIGDILLQELKDMIEQEFPSSDNDYSTSIISRHEVSLTKHAFSLFNVPNTEKNIKLWGDNGYRILLVTGSPGIGTSNVLAFITNHMREHYTCKVLYYDFECADSRKDLMDDFDEFMQLEENQVPDDEWSMIAIDNASLLDMEQTERMMHWLHNKPENLHPVFAATNSILSDTLRLHHYDTITQHGMSQEMQYEMISNFTARYGKNLTKEQQDKIVQGKHSNDPTILTILLETLINFGSFEELDKRIDHLVKEANYSIFAGLMLEAQDIFTKVNLTDCFEKSLVVIAMHGDYGISEKDLISAMNLKMAEWAVVRPMVLQFCTGNSHRLRFIQSAWRQDVKNFYQTLWISHLGCEMAAWWGKQQNRVKESASSIAAIYLYIWHLPFIAEEENHLKQQVLSIMLSPDTVRLVRRTYLSSIWAFVWFRDIRFFNDPPTIIGRSMAELSHTEKIEHYQRLILVAESLNKSDDVAWCYRQIARLQTDETQAVIYEAHALLAEGRANKAMQSVTGFLHRVTGSQDEIFKKRLIRLEALLLKESEADIAKELERLFDLIEKMPEENIYESEEMINLWVQICYQFAFKGLGEVFEMAVDMVNKSIENDMMDLISVANPNCYYFCMARAFISLKTGQLDRMLQDANLALSSAWFAFGGASYQYGRADILQNYAYKKLHGKLLDIGCGYQNLYTVPLYIKKGNEATADKDVLKAIKWENDVFKQLIDDLGVEIQDYKNVDRSQQQPSAS